VKPPAPDVPAVLPIKAGLSDALEEDLADAVFGIVRVGMAGRMEKIQFLILEILIPLRHPSIRFEHALHLVHQSHRKATEPPVPCLGVLFRKKDRGTGEVEMFELNSYELSDSASEFVDHLKHELLAIFHGAIEEFLEFLQGQVPYRLAKTVVFSRRLHICRFGDFGRLFHAWGKGIFGHFLHTWVQM